MSYSALWFGQGFLIGTINGPHFQVFSYCWKTPPLLPSLRRVLFRCWATSGFLQTWSLELQPEHSILFFSPSQESSMFCFVFIIKPRLRSCWHLFLTPFHTKIAQLYGWFWEKSWLFQSFSFQTDWGNSATVSETCFEFFWLYGLAFIVRWVVSCEILNKNM